MTNFTTTQSSSLLMDDPQGPGYPARPPSFPYEGCSDYPSSEYGIPANLESLVHTSETKTPDGEIGTYRHHRAQNCVDELAAVRQVYETLDAGNPNGKHLQLDGCRKNAWFARQKDTGIVKVFSSACRLRWCPMCAKSKQAYITRSTSEWLKTVGYPKLLTLTILHTELPLSEQIDNLYGYFKRLRKRKAFSKKVDGGVWFFQVKISKIDGLWHPHLHCLISGLSIAHSTIKRIWKEVSFTSEIVDIRSIKDKDNAARHVARYAARPSELINLDIDKRLELVEAMHGRRLVGTWGNARSVSLKPPKSDDHEDWESVGSWSIVTGLLENDARARKIFNAWKNSLELPAGVTCKPVDDFIAEEYIWGSERPPPGEYQHTFFEDN